MSRRSARAARRRSCAASSARHQRPLPARRPWCGFGARFWAARVAMQAAILGRALLRAGCLGPGARPFRQPGAAASRSTRRGVIARRRRRPRHGRRAAAAADGDRADPWWLQLRRATPSGRASSRGCRSARSAMRAATARTLSSSPRWTPEPSGDDCTLLAIDAAHAIAERDAHRCLPRGARRSPTPIASVEHDGGASHLVELDAFIAPGDARLAEALALGRRRRCG